MKVKELLSDETKWCKKEMFIEKNGSMAYCLIGAIRECYSNGYNYDRIYEYLQKKYGYVRKIITWNAAPETTFQDVKNLVEELDI